MNRMNYNDTTLVYLMQRHTACFIKDNERVIQVIRNLDTSY